MKKFSILIVALIPVSLFLLMGCSKGKHQTIFQSDWNNSPQRMWVGPDFWANRLQDWQVDNGRLECVRANFANPMRTVHLLTTSLNEKPASFSISVETGLIRQEKKTVPTTAAGFLVGIAPSIDYRAAALVHHSYGRGGGIFAGINAEGNLFLADREEKDKFLLIKKIPTVNLKHVKLILEAVPFNNGFNITLTCQDPAEGRLLGKITKNGVLPQRLQGGTALVSHPGLPYPQDETLSAGRFWFNDLKVSGNKVTRHPDRNCGPIISSQYTLSNNILKLTAQMMPLGTDDFNTVQLQLKKEGQWHTLQETGINFYGSTATFKITDWKSDLDTPYRLKYRMKRNNGRHRFYHWEGTVRKEPAGDGPFTIAAFTGNHNTARPVKGKWASIDGEWFPYTTGIWFPHNDIVKHVRAHQPDLLFSYSSAFFMDLADYLV